MGGPVADLTYPDLHDTYEGLIYAETYGPEDTTRRPRAGWGGTWTEDSQGWQRCDTGRRFEDGTTTWTHQYPSKTPRTLGGRQDTVFATVWTISTVEGLGDFYGSRYG